MDQLPGRIRLEDSDLLMADELEQLVLIVVCSHRPTPIARADGPPAPRELEQVGDGGVVLPRAIGAGPVGDQDTDRRATVPGHLLQSEARRQEPESPARCSWRRQSSAPARRTVSNGTGWGPTCQLAVSET